MNRTETIRKVLETHRIGPNSANYMQKCAGCPWIGWIHDVHLAETIDLALVAEKWFAQANQTQTKIDLEGENHEG